MAESQRMIIENIGGKTHLYVNPTLRRNVWKFWEKIFRNPFCGVRRCKSSEVELREGDHFLVSFIATQPRR